MGDAELVGRIVKLLRELHEDERGWNSNLDTLLACIAEVEGSDKGFSPTQVALLIESLVFAVAHRRGAVGFNEN